MDVPGLSCSPGVGICECDTLICCYIHLLPPHPVSRREGVLVVFYLFIFIFIFYYPKAIYKYGNYLYKMGGVVGFFLPPERWHIS